MSLDRYDNDGGTWGIAMTAHGALKMMHTAEDGFGAYLAQGMAPLGSRERIKQFIAAELDMVRRQTPGGVLPHVTTFPVVGSPTPLVIPAALPAETILSLQAAASVGLDSIASVVETLNDTGALRDTALHEQMWRANHPDASDLEVRQEMARWRRSTGTPEPTPRNSRATLENLCREAGIASSDEEIDSALAALDTDGSHADTSALTSVQNYAALASVLGSIAQVTYDTATAATEAEGSEALQTAKRVFDTIAPVCDAVAAITSLAAGTGVGAIVAVVFEVLALICRFFSWLLDAIAGYTVSPNEGWNAEWSTTDGMFILRERLRVLALVEENVVDSSPTGWAARFGKLVADGTLSSEEQKNLIKDWVTRTALLRGKDRVGNAVAIARAVGDRGATASFNMCEDIHNWMLYVGMKPERADMIFTWLYEARKVTVTRERRKKLADMIGSNPHGGTGYGVEYTGNMVTYVGTGVSGGCANDRERRCNGLASSGLCKLNFEYGSDRWYENCRGLDVTDSSKFVPFSATDLEGLYSQLAVELEVTVGVSGGAMLTGGRYVPLTAESMQNAAYRALQSLIGSDAPRPSKCGFARVGVYSVLWFVQSRSNPLVTGPTSIASDARSYAVTLQSSGSFPTMVAFIGLPNLVPTPAGVYVRPAERPYAPCPVQQFFNQGSFRRQVVEAIGRSSKATRPRTVFSAGASGSSSGGGVAIGLGVAAAAAVAAFVIAK